MRPHNYSKSLGKLVKYAKSEGFSLIDLEYNNTSYISWVRGSLNTPSVIKIEGGYSDEVRVYLFLHELGHHELRKDWDRFSLEFPILSRADEELLYNKNRKYRRGLSYDVSCMEEEFKAWDEGYRLGKLLGIRINKDNWYSLRVRCLMSYIRFYGRSKKK